MIGITRRLSGLKNGRVLSSGAKPVEFADPTGGDGEPNECGGGGNPRLLQVVPVGRTFLPEDNNPPGPARGLIITYGLWQKRFGGDSSIVGEKIYLAGRPYPVIGVMPKDSTWPTDRDVLAPLAVGPNPGPDLQRRDNMIFFAIAHLKPDATATQANASLAGIAARLEEDYPESRQGWSNRVVNLRDYVVGSQSRTSLLILLAVVGCVLLIACVNVANLLLVRAAAREREMAIRLALGAGRFRLIRQPLTESLLTIIGGGAGLLLAVWELIY
jgi:putative ABC transport system permease protein